MTAQNGAFSLALAGGGARGFAHISVLETLDELGIKPAGIAGTSIGAIYGAGYAAGLSGNDLRQLSLEMLSNRSKAAQRLWQTRSIRRSRSALLSIPQFIPEQLAQAFLADHIPDDFSTLNVPLAVIATNYYTWEEVNMTSGNLMTAIAGSFAIPGLMRPVLREEHVLIDGGAVNPFPCDAAAKIAPNHPIIGVDVMGGPRSEINTIPGALEAGIGALRIMMHAISDEKLKDFPPDIMVRPDLGDFGPLDFLGIKNALAASDLIKDDLKRQIERLMTSEPAALIRD